MKRIKSTGIILMLTIVLLSFSIPVSADPIDNDVWCLAENDGHVEMGDIFDVTFNITINEEINSIGLDNVTFTQTVINGTGTVNQGNALVAGATVIWLTADWSTNDGGYASPLATWAKTLGTNNSAGYICNTTWNAIAVGVGYINFTDVCGTSMGAADKGTVFHNGTVYVHPAHPVGPSATAFNETQINLSWTKGAGADRTVVVAKENSLPVNLDDGAVIYNNTGTSYDHDGLSAGEHWYYRFYSWHTSESMFSVNNVTTDETTLENIPPVFGTPSPLNGSSGNNLSFDWQISINDPDGDTFNWTIECNNSQTSSDNDASNGTKSLSISGLANNVTYTVWVNATDGVYTREWFTFTTLVVGAPNPPPLFTATADGRFEINLTWDDPLGDETDKVYIEWNTTSGWNVGEGTELYNGTGNSTTHTGLSHGTTRYYQAWGWNESGSVYSLTFNSDNDTTDSNIAPNYGIPSPTNGSSGQSLSLTWEIVIQDAEGDTFNWSIECNNSQSDSANNEGNGTKDVSLSGLSYNIEYTVWVNTTDSYNWTREWFTFTTTALDNPPVFSAESPTNGASGVVHTISSWSLQISDLEGDSFNWTIDTSPDIGNSSADSESNGTKVCSLTNAQYGTEYTVYVNATGSGGWKREWFTFTIEDAPNIQPYQPSNPDPENNEPDVPINIGEFSCLVSDPDGDSLDCNAYWSNHTLIDTNNSVANNTVVRFDVGTLEKDTIYYWYVNVSDGEFTVQSPVWNFSTMINRAPDIPVPLPLDSATSVSSTLGQLKVLVTDPDGDICNVSFYWGDDTLIGSVIGVTNNTYASVSIPTLTVGHTYLWYVNVTDTEEEWTRGPTSGNWTFTVASDGDGGGGGGAGGNDDDDVDDDDVPTPGIEINYGAIVVIAMVIAIAAAIAIYYRSGQSNK